MPDLFGGPVLGYQTKGEIVYQRLRAAILDGALLPGDRLNVDELARQLGVSKIPVREALQRLETQGLIVQTPHAGARVASLSLREITGVYHMRAELEGLAARLAAPLITDAELHTLRANHAGMTARYDAGDLPPLGSLNEEFHRLIAHATGYTTLEETIMAMFLSVARYRVVLPVDVHSWPQVIEEHRSIIAALAAHDAVEAERLSRLHVANQLPNDIRRESLRLREGEPAATE